MELCRKPQWCVGGLLGDVGETTPTHPVLKLDAEPLAVEADVARLCRAVRLQRHRFAN